MSSRRNLAPHEHQKGHFTQDLRNVPRTAPNHQVPNHIRTGFRMERENGGEDCYEKWRRHIMECEFQEHDMKKKKLSKCSEK